jgi:DNA-binding response OmpR family regulator
MELGKRPQQQTGWQMRSVDESIDGGLVALADATTTRTDLRAAAVLVVEQSLDHRLLSLARLTRAGFRVTVAETFASAKLIVVSQPTDVLITGIRLGTHNGLHLVLRAKAAQPRLAALVTASPEDRGLRDEAQALGATFVLTPVGERELIGAVLQTVYRSDPTIPVEPPFERRLGERRKETMKSPDEKRNGDRRRTLPWLAPGRPIDSI